MAEPIVAPQVDGQEIEIPDVANLGAVAGLADDRILAELTRLTPYDGNVYKGVIPYGFKGALGATYPGATVESTGAANGTIQINPFRLIIGSRNSVTGAPPGANPAAIYQPNSLANWRDIRSGIFMGSASSLSVATQLAANSSGEGRWDLVYATLSLDANGPSQSRRVKSPSTAVVSVQSVPAWLASPVTVTVLTGVPSSTPVIPTVPADSAGNYNAPLAAIYVANGFGTGTTVLSENIRSLANATSNYMLAPGHGAVEPATGNNDRTGTYATNFPWAPRPGPFIPPDMVGKKEVLIEIDCTNSNPSLWSHPPGSIVDNSIDWRKRFTRALCGFGASSLKLATDPTAVGTTPPVPTMSSLSAYQVQEQFTNTFQGDGSLVGSSATVLLLDPITVPTVFTTGAIAGLYVFTDGTLRWMGNTSGTGPVGYVFAIWVQASAAMPNA